MRRRGFLLAVTLLGWAVLGPGGTGAQPLGGKSEFTVDELVTHALGQNQDLQAMRAEVDATLGRLQQAGLRPNPMLELNGQRSPYSTDNNLMVGVTVPLDLNGRLEGRIGVADREAELKR